MKKEKVDAKFFKNRIVIVVIILCILTVAFIFVLIQNKKAAVEFVYQNRNETSATYEMICNAKSWSAKDIGLQIIDNGEDVSAQVKEEKKERQLGMEITYTWKDSTFTLFVQDKNYTPPIFSGEQNIILKQGSGVSKEISTYGIHANDYCGRDISNKVVMNKDVDTSIIGEQVVKLSIEDDFMHTSEYVITFLIEEDTTSSTIEYNDGIANPFSITPKIIEEPGALDVLVNKFNALPDGWEPDDLLAISSNNGREMLLRKEAADAYERMNAAALQDDITIKVISAYRSKSYQQSLFDSYYAKDQEYAMKFSALPRRSEHETGLAIDVSYDGYLYDDLDSSDLGMWMNAHAHEYGFMLRFLKGKENITNYGYEPWHYRYVGQALATKIKNSTLTMEEYYGQK